MMNKLYGTIAVLILACAFLSGATADTVTFKGTTVPGSPTKKTTDKPEVVTPVSIDTIKDIIGKCNKEANDVLGDRDANMTSLDCCVALYTRDCLAKNCTACSDQQKKSVNVIASCDAQQIKYTLSECKALPVKSKLGLIIGCVIGIALILALIILIAVVSYKKFHNKPKDGEVKFKLGKHMNIHSEVDEVVVVDAVSNAGSVAGVGSSAVSGTSGISGMSGVSGVSVGFSVASKAGATSSEAFSKSKFPLSTPKDAKGKGKGNAVPKNKAKDSLTKPSSIKVKASSIQGKASKEKVAGKIKGKKV